SSIDRTVAVMTTWIPASFARFNNAFLLSSTFGCSSSGRGASLPKYTYRLPISSYITYPMAKKIKIMNESTTNLRKILMLSDSCNISFFTYSTHRQRGRFLSRDGNLAVQGFRLKFKKKIIGTVNLSP